VYLPQAVCVARGQNIADETQTLWAIALGRSPYRASRAPEQSETVKAGLTDVSAQQDWPTRDLTVRLKPLVPCLWSLAFSALLTAAAGAQAPAVADDTTEGLVGEAAAAPPGSSASAAEDELALQADETAGPEGEAGSADQPGAQGEEPVAARARSALRAGAVSSELRLDGQLDDPAWATADSIENLTTVEPEEGERPAGRTTAKVLVTPSELIIGIMCYDKRPKRIVSFSKARDAELEEEDHVLIVLDPFRDGRSGYVFMVNPSGARVDGLVSTQTTDEFNRNWDALWEAKTARSKQGWGAEIRIPIKSLSFKRGLTSWGFNVERRIQRLQEVSRWSGASQDYEVFQTSRAGLLTDLPVFDYGLGLSVRPAVVASTNRLSPDVDRDYDGELSLDVSQRIGSNVVASATVNTDFAETEVDARQTNLTRFDLFFPEKRSFFLEGADIFEFGVGMDEEIFVPFFTRRIGLVGEEDELQQIPITAGGKVNGRMGNTNFSALTVRTGAEDNLGLDATTMGAVRLKQNVLSESSVGMLATFGDPLGRSDSWMAGADATFQTSNFMGEKNFLVGAWGLRNDRADLVEGGKTAYGGQIAFPNDLIDVGVKVMHFDESFEPSLGFVPRTGTFLEAGGEINPRPRWSLVHQMVHEFTYFAVVGHDKEIESHRLTIKPFDWLLSSGDRFEFIVQPEGERLVEPFDISGDVVIPTGSYRWIRYSAGAFTAPKRPISGSMIFTFGDFYRGNLNTLELIAKVQPATAFGLEFGVERNSGNLPEGDFVEAVYSGRVEFRYSSDLQLSSLLQYDNESESLGTNTRLRWTFHPLGDLFVVFNHNLARTINDRFRFDSNELLVKLQYALRM
jgi:Domain of unknown function (DUF5916)